MRYITLLLFVFVTLSINSCSSTEKLLMREWQVTGVEFTDSLNTLTPAQKTVLTDNLKNKIRFTFMADSVFQVKNDQETLKGTWWVSKNGKELFTRMNDNTTESELYTVKKKNLRFQSEGDMNQSFIFNCIPVIYKK